MRKAGHLLQAGIILCFYTLFRVLPLDVASGLGSLIARALGPLIRAHHTARVNLGIVFPHMPEAEKRHILREMWDNLGRNIAEMSHLGRPSLAARIDVSGESYLEVLRNDNKGGLLVSAHYGNWEILPYVAKNHHLPLTMVYRRINNPYVEALLLRWRKPAYAQMYPKGAKGVFGLIRALHQGAHLAILVDQKMNDGIRAPFLGHPAMTAPAAAELALKLNIPILMSRIRRLKGCHFVVEIHPPLTAPEGGPTAENILTLTTTINDHFSKWILQDPRQWFWVHRRWEKERYRKAHNG